MSSRRTNLALLLLLGVALLTGALAFATGTGWARWPVMAHGMAGLAIVLLAPWKSAIARRSHRPSAERATSLVLTVLVVIALVSGILFVTAGRGLRYGPLNAMQVHVGAALVAIPFAVYHVIATRLLPRRTDFSRRNLLRAGLLGGAAAVAYGLVEGANRLLGLPGADRRFTGSYETGSMTGNFPTTQWLDDEVQDIDRDAWRLQVIAGDRSASLDYARLARYDDAVTTVLDCTSGWYSTQEWRGARLDALLDDAAGESIVVRSATGYTRRFPRSDAAGLLLATRVAGEPLSAGHGAPARLVAPGRRGFWWVKWVVSIEVDDRPWWLQLPFPAT